MQIGLQVSILENNFFLDMMFVLIQSGADLDRKDERVLCIIV
ncbi:hypothetical protein LEP1GSC084_4621 [Leptospira interrogans serovar Medanensis str. L0448]|nr:hypothetical protein LEP1GSC099_3591 [Leptospira interrogans str. UI 08452]EMN36291.1 hypothetical protein LEP1GSC084_4621 [Leptospira interrogans serovar Medanensis str. L0448]EMN41291.1 hypothetical protein LEP1GSC085_3840 [Leptospira interrogans str. L0996]